MKNQRREEEQVIDEIRAARRAIWRKAGGTAAGLVRLLSDTAPPSKGATRTQRRSTAQRRRAAPSARKDA